MPPTVTIPHHRLPGATPGAAGAVRRAWRASEFRPEELAARRSSLGLAVYVVIPARDEERTIGPIVRSVRHDLMLRTDLVDDVVVVDDASLDATAAVARREGATVVPGPGAGKGEAMAAGVAALGVSGDR